MKPSSAVSQSAPGPIGRFAELSARAPRAIARCLVGCLAGCLSLSVLPGCHRKQAPELELVLGPESSFRFAPQVGYAELYQLPDGSDELRITLASYGADCAHYVPVPPGEVAVTLSVATPMGRPIEPRDYPVGDAPAEATKAGSASTFVRLHSDTRTVTSPGSLTLQKLEPRLHGSVMGQILQVPAPSQDPKLAQVALTGGFDVRLCRAVLDPNRKTSP